LPDRAEEMLDTITPSVEDVGLRDKSHCHAVENVLVLRPGDTAETFGEALAQMARLAGGSFGVVDLHVVA